MSDDLEYVVSLVTNVDTAAEEFRTALQSMATAYEQVQAKLGTVSGSNGLAEQADKGLVSVDALTASMERLVALSRVSFSGNGFSALKSQATEVTGQVRELESVIRQLAQRGIATPAGLTQSFAAQKANELRLAGAQQIAADREAGTVVPRTAAANIERAARRIEAVPQLTDAEVSEAIASFGAMDSKLRALIAEITRLKQLGQSSTALRAALESAVTGQPNALLARDYPELQPEIRGQSRIPSASANGLFLAGNEPYSINAGKFQPGPFLPPISASTEAQQEAGQKDYLNALNRTKGLIERQGLAAGKLATAEEEAAAAQQRGIAGSFAHGFTSGGWAGVGGGSNALSGLAETAGVLAKYALVGRSLLLLQEFGRSTLEEFSRLDAAIANYNVVIGSAGAANDTFVSSLENISAAAGVNIVDSLAAATRGVAAFSEETSTASQKRQIGRDFTSAAVTNAVITGQKVGPAANDLIAVGTSFGIASEGIGQINDAIATAHAKFGSSALDISNGVKLLADDAKAAGYTMSETAQVVGLDAARLAESGQEVATNLQRVFAQFQAKAGQQALTSVGVDTSGTVKQQIEGLAAAWSHLTEKERQHLEGTLGGAKALKELLPLLNDNTQLQEAFSKALTDGGAGQRLANAQLNSLSGTMKVLGATLKNIALDVSRTGIFDPIIASLALLKPALQTLDKFIQLWDNLVPGPGKFIAATLLEIYAAVKLFEKVSVGEKVAGAVASAKSFVTGAGPVEGALTPASVIAATAASQGVNEASAARLAASSEAVRTAYATKDAEKIAVAETANIAAIRAETALRETTTVKIAADAAVLDAAKKAEAKGSLTVSEAAARLNVAFNRTNITTDELAATTESAVGALTEFIAATLASARAAAANATASTLNATASSLAEGGLLNRLGFGGGRLGFLGGASIGKEAGLGLTAGTAAAGAFFSYELLGKVGSQIKAEKAGLAASDNAATITPTSQSLGDSAYTLSKAADDLKKSSGGLFGTISSFAQKLAGQETAGNRANDIKQFADLQAFEKTNLDKVAVNSNQGGFIDFSAVDGVKTGLQNLANAGGSAKDQIDALVGGLDNLSKTVEGHGVIQAGSVPLLAQQISDETVNAGLHGVNNSVNLHGVNVPISKLLGEQGAEKLNTDLSGDITKYINDKGLVGKPLQGADYNGLIDNTVKNLKARLDEQLKPIGESFAQLPQKTQDKLIQAAKDSVTHTYYGVLAAPHVDINKQNITEALAALPAATQAYSADVTNTSLLAGDTQNQAAVNGAKEALRVLQQARDDAAKAGAKPAELDQISVEIRAAQVQLLNVTMQNLDALGQIAAANLLPFDASGQIDAALATLDAKIAAAPAGVGRDLLIAQRVNAARQLAQQHLTDSITQLSAAAGSNPVAQAQASASGAQAQASLDAGLLLGQNLQNASSILHSFFSGGKPTVVDTSSLNAKIAADAKAQRDAQYAASAALAAQQNSLGAAAVNPYNTAAVINQQIRAAQNSLRALPPDATGARADLQAQIKNLYKSLADNAVATANGAREASVIAGDAISAATERLSEAYATLANATSSQRGSAQAAVNQARYDLTKAQVGTSNARLESQLVPGDVLAGAWAKIQEATANVNTDARNSQQYYSDLTALRAAQNDFAQAELQHSSQLQRLSIDLTNPVQVAQQNLKDAQAKLAYDQGRGADTTQDQLDVVNTKAAADSAAFTQQLSAAQTADQLGQISHTAYLNFLRNQGERIKQQMAGMNQSSQEYQQLTDELNTIGQDILAANNQLVGQFNIGNIKVPTPYEVRRSIASTAAGQNYQSTNSNVVINVNGANYDQVSELLGSYLGPVTTGQYTIANRKV